MPQQNAADLSIPPSGADDLPLKARVRVRTYELDSFGHVNNAAYLNYLEEARSEYLRHFGLSFNDFAAWNVQLVIIEAHIRYHSPSRYGDTLVIAGAFRDVRAASLTVHYRITDEATGRLVAVAQTRGAFITPDTGKPTRAPDAFRAVLGKPASERAI